MRSTILLLFLAVWLAAGSPSPLAADAPPGVPSLCGDYRTLVELLARRYDERPQSLGLGDDGRVLELFTSEEGGSWTMLSVAPDGRSCVLATGRDWQQRRAAVAEPDA